jgi:hypothetical protein
MIRRALAGGIRSIIDAIAVDFGVLKVRLASRYSG